MQTLQQYMFESIVNEAFASKNLASLFNVSKQYHDYLLNDRWGSSYQLQWDKVTDDMMREVTEDEARKLQRKQKESYYILWVTEERGDNNREMIYCITWGYDCIAACYRRQRGETTKASIDSHTCKKAYVIEGDVEKLMRRELHREREEAKRGATALMSAYQILTDNQKRYQTALNKMHTAGAEEVQKWLNEGMEAYKNAIENYVLKMSDALLTDCPTSWKIRNMYEKLNKTFNKMLEEIETYKSFTDPKRGYYSNDSTGSSIGRKAANEVKSCSALLVELCTNLMAEINA